MLGRTSGSSKKASRSPRGGERINASHVLDDPPSPRNSTPGVRRRRSYNVPEVDGGVIAKDEARRKGAEKLKSTNNTSFFRRRAHSANKDILRHGSIEASAQTVNRGRSMRSLMRDPQTPVTAESSAYRSPGQISRRSNEAILQEINQRVDESDVASETPPLQSVTADAPIHMTSSNADLSVITDDFHRSANISRPDVRGNSGLYDLDDDISDVSMVITERQVHKQESHALFTFRRRHVSEDSDDGETTSTIFETTLNAKTFGPGEESMEDIVKRLQQKGASSGVLKFKRDLIEKIRAGEKDVVFVLVQINGAKFCKDEFGRMMASQLTALTRERPIVIEIKVEDVLQGDTIDLF